MTERRSGGVFAANGQDQAKDGKWMVNWRTSRQADRINFVVPEQDRLEVDKRAGGRGLDLQRQSNMEWPLDKARGFNEVAVSTNAATTALGWCRRPKRMRPRRCSKHNERGSGDAHGFIGRGILFSAVTCRKPQRARRLIDTCWGGSPAEVWMSQMRAHFKIPHTNATSSMPILAAVAKAEGNPKGSAGCGNGGTL